MHYVIEILPPFGRLNDKWIILSETFPVNSKVFVYLQVELENIIITS